jgi:DNA recombination protein RmuC
LDDVVGKCTRAIEKRLKGVDTLSNEEVKQILPELMNGDGLGDEE